MRLPLRSPVSSPIHAAIAVGIGMLVSLACIGALMEQPGSQARQAVASSSADMAFVTATILQAAEHPLPVNVSSRNLQLPRAPRHRSDRPTSGSADAEAITATKIFDVLGADTDGSLIADGARACPLSGHPLSLLRPPSLLAG